MSRESQNAIDWRSLPKAKQTVDQAYNLAFRIVQQMRVISCCQVDWYTLSSIAFTEQEGPQHEIDHWVKFREEQANKLEVLLMQLESDTQHLKTLFSPLWDLLQAFTYDDLKDFVSGDHNWGRSAYPAIQNLQLDVNIWGLRCKNFYEIRGFQPLDPKLQGKCEELAASFPMNTEIESDLIERLYREQGLLVNRLSEAQPLFVTQSPESFANTSGQKTKGKKRKRRKAGSNELTDAQEKLASAIRAWHKYDPSNLSIAKEESISYAELCEWSDVGSKSTVTAFFNKWLGDDGNKKYQKLCKGKNPKQLAFEIARLSPLDFPSQTQSLPDEFPFPTPRRLDDDGDEDET